MSVQPQLPGPAAHVAFRAPGEQLGLGLRTQEPSEPLQGASPGERRAVTFLPRLEGAAQQVVEKRTQKGWTHGGLLPLLPGQGCHSPREGSPSTWLSKAQAPSRAKHSRKVHLPSPPEMARVAQVRTKGPCTVVPPPPGQRCTLTQLPGAGHPAGLLDQGRC